MGRLKFLNFVAQKLKKLFRENFLEKIN